MKKTIVSTQEFKHGVAGASRAARKGPIIKLGQQSGLPSDSSAMCPNTRYRSGILFRAFNPRLLIVLATHAGWSQAAEIATTELRAPAWTQVESASFHASSVDPTHALLSSIVQKRQLNPLRAARLFAAVRVAQAEAVGQLPSMDPEAVAALAASQAMSWLLPQEDQARWVGPTLLRAARSLGSVDEATSRVDATIRPVMARTVDDGGDARRRPLTKPEPRPGVWLRTPPLFAEQPSEPQGADWKPWCPGSDSVDIPPAVRHGSLQWQEEVKQVAAVGATLTAAQQAIAHRWHLDAGSVTPPGVWNAIAASYVFEVPQPAAQRHRVLAVLNMAMQDALVASWRVKLTYWSERPVTAVRRELDPGFEPFLVTPPFPGYVSGHATVSASAAGVLSHFFPEQRSRWSALANEAAASRLYGGIHFLSDNEYGLELGAKVAQRCLAAFGATGRGQTERLVTAPAGMSPDFFAFPRMRVLPE